MIGQFAAWFTSSLILYLFYEMRVSDKINSQPGYFVLFACKEVVNNDCFKFCCMNLIYQYCLPIILVTSLVFSIDTTNRLKDFLKIHLRYAIYNITLLHKFLPAAQYGADCFKPSNYCFTVFNYGNHACSIETFQLSEN